MKYDKLVRDMIPEIIERNGAEAVTRILTDEEFKEYLEKKLDEEVAEFHESRSIEELADILDVIYELSGIYGSVEDLLIEHCRKNAAHGGFSKKILLIATIEEGKQ